MLIFQYLIFFKDSNPSPRWKNISESIRIFTYSLHGRLVRDIAPEISRDRTMARNSTHETTIDVKIFFLLNKALSFCVGPL